MSYVCREFSSARWKVMKEDSGVSNAQAWGCPCTPNKYSRRLKRLSLGMPPMHPFFINNHRFVSRCTIFLSLHALCALLGAYGSLLFLGLFCFLCCSNKLDPNLIFFVWRETRSA